MYFTHPTCTYIPDSWAGVLVLIFCINSGVGGKFRLIFSFLLLIEPRLLTEKKLSDESLEDLLTSIHPFLSHRSTPSTHNTPLHAHIFRTAIFRLIPTSPTGFLLPYYHISSTSASRDPISFFSLETFSHIISGTPSVPNIRTIEQRLNMSMHALTRRLNLFQYQFSCSGETEPVTVLWSHWIVYTGPLQTR